MVVWRNLRIMAPFDGGLAHFEDGVAHFEDGLAQFEGVSGAI